MEWIFYSLAGVISGCLAGMGMGGGTILIPVLTLLLGVDQHIAQGLNIVSFIPAAALSLFIHHKEGRLKLKECVPVILAGAATALLAAFLASAIDAPWLRRLFGGFLIVLAAVNLLTQKSRDGGKS